MATELVGYFRDDHGQEWAVHRHDDDTLTFRPQTEEETKPHQVETFERVEA